MLDCAQRGDAVINRREFLEAAAVSALPTIASATPRVGVQADVTLAALPTIVIDSRYAESRNLGSALAAQGASVLALPDGDVTQLWLQQLGPAWRQQPVPISGLSARPALFCLEQLALGRGLRVVFHAEHVVHAAGRTEHRLLRGAQTAGLSSRGLALTGPSWPTRIAEVLTQHARFAGRERHGLSAAALSPVLPPGATLLTSWIIAA
jgi:hypothetical protein